MTIPLRCTIAAFATAVLVISGGTAAAAQTEGTDPSVVATQASASVNMTTDANGTTITTASSEGDHDAVEFGIPGAPSEDAVDLAAVPRDLQSGAGQPVASTEIDGALLTSYASDVGVQTLIEIADAGSPTEYAFPFEMPGGSSLQLQPSGAVFVNDATGLPAAMLDVPWAFDANGAPVPTSFRVEGSTVVQVVDTSAVTAYPVVADPDFWWIVTNSAGCLAEIAGLSLVGAKAVQVFAKADRIVRAAAALGKYYDALGGKIDKVIGIFKKWINNKASLTRKQLTALEGLIREGAKIFFNAVGLGTCYSLVKGS